MPINIKSTKDVKINGIKMVIYGQAGIGKTVLCSTAPKPIIISAERGLLSLADIDIPYIEVKTVNDIGDAFKFLRNNDDYETICIDSLSEITETVLAKIQKDMVSESSSGKIDKRQSYARLAESMSPMIRNFRDLDGKNVVFTAKQRTREDEYTGLIVHEPSMPGRVLPENLPYMLDEVLCMRMDLKSNRVLQTQPDTNYTAKDRSGKLEKFEQPNLNEIFNKILKK